MSLITRYFMIGLMSVAFVAILIHHKCNADAETANRKISMQFKDAALGDIVDQIGRKAGYSIKIPADWRGATVTVLTETVDLEYGIKRVLSSAGIANYALISDERKKTLVIKVLDDRDPNQIRAEGRTPISAKTNPIDVDNSRPPAHLMPLNRSENSPNRAKKADSPPPDHMVRQQPPGTKSVTDISIPNPPEATLRNHLGINPALGRRDSISPPPQAIVFK